MFDNLPPELLAYVFEIGVHNWGLRFLPPLCLTCRAWNEVTVSTPRLWGIVDLHRRSNIPLIQAQITKACSSPLTIRIHFPSGKGPKKSKKILDSLLSLKHNWVDVELSTTILMPGAVSWNDLLPVLERLRLDCVGYSESGAYTAAAAFFAESRQDVVPKLRSFAAVQLPSCWVRGFLGPTITAFEVTKKQSVPLTEILGYLQMLPNVASLTFSKLSITQFLNSNTKHVRLPKLLDLHVEEVLNFPYLLSLMACPNLSTLFISGRPCNLRWDIRNAETRTSPKLLFTQWSQPGFIPVSLHTLTLESDCVDATDLPFLNGFLTRTPSLVRLKFRQVPGHILSYTFPTAGLPNSILTAVPVASCPGLMQLFVYECDMSVRELLDLCLSKNLNHSPLRLVEAPLCPNGTSQEIEELRKIVEEVRCTCLGCEMTVFGELPVESIW